MRKFLSAFSILALMVLVFSGTVSALEGTLTNVVVVKDGTPNTYRTKAATVEEFFEEANIQMDEYDSINVKLEDTITPDLKINFLTGIQVIVKIDPDADSIPERIQVKKGTLAGNFIESLEKERGKKYVYDGGYAEELLDQSQITLQTLNFELIVTKSPVMFEKQIVLTDQLDLDVEQLKTEGALGESETTTKVYYVNGVESSREFVSEKVTKEPINEIIEKGTRVAPAPTPVPVVAAASIKIPQPVVDGYKELGLLKEQADTTLKFEKELSMTATAFTAGYESTGKNPGDHGYGLTASGLHVGKGIVAVDPDIIPLGTKLYVEGYGYSIAADTGSAVVGDIIDLYYENLDDAMSFGRRSLKVYVLAEQ